MAEFATKLKDGQPFNPYKWQLNEVIWASIKAPYPEQWERWQRPVQGHGGIDDLFRNNLYRAVLFVENHHHDQEGLNHAAVNLGKLAAGFTCSLAHLATPRGAWQAPVVDLRPYQSKMVDSVLDAAESGPSIDLTSEENSASFEEALITAHEAAGMGTKDTLARMRDILFPQAANTTRAWLDFIEENDGQFEMSPGATPRSSGEQIENLRKQSEHLFVK